MLEREPLEHPRIGRVGAIQQPAAGRYVLYWMSAARRTHFNFALDRAVRWCERLGLPLLIYEPLSCSYRWCSPRFHRFVIDGMQDNAAHCAQHGVRYLPHIETAPGAARGALTLLAREAALVVSDEYPSFFLPRLVEAAARQLSVPLELVDSNGVLPLASCSQAFPTAYAFRRYLQKNLRPFLSEFPASDRLATAKIPRTAELPSSFEQRYPSPALDELDLGSLPLDKRVGVVAERGGARAARAALARFVEHGLPRYQAERSEPSSDAASGLSPWLHFGHIAVHEVLRAITEREAWSVAKLSTSSAGKREGWWNLDANSESFLDELITWRELGYQFAHKRADHERYDSLPDWARDTLAAHASDPREVLYDLEAFESARTHDALWNAAQRQLVREGRMHNYLRMLWGKKILEWSATPQQALEIMIELNNKYALDGRDPNSYSGIAWVLGRFDRPWAPKRPIFGSIRYMSSQNTARKFDVGPYLARYAPLTSAK